jgi:Type II CAAX prenyl endopeptidase Rce1-like
MQQPIDQRQPAVTDSEESGQLSVFARDGSIHLIHLMPPPFVAAALPLSPEEWRFRVGDLAVLLLVAFGPPIVASISALWLGGLTTSANAVVRALANLVIFEVVGLILLAHLLFRQRRSFKSIGLGFTWRDLPLGVLLVVASYLASAACWLAITAITSKVTGHAPAASRAPDPLYVGVVGLNALVWAVVFVNPWFEELIMRAYTMSEITALGGRATVAVAASVGLQLLYHLYQGVPRALAIAGGSLVCSLFYQRYRCIMPVILAHLVMDVLAVSHIVRP